MKKKRRSKSSVASSSKVKTDKEYCAPKLAEVPDESMVVVENFDPANPGAELAEPTKVLVTSNDRRARKSNQRKNLDKS